jgi:hypothetical protein
LFAAIILTCYFNDDYCEQCIIVLQIVAAVELAENDKLREDMPVIGYNNARIIFFWLNFTLRMKRWKNMT